MTIRTSKKKVTFRKPFVLGEFDEVLPAGQYDVETESAPKDRSAGPYASVDD
jgi:hypothetical protein